MSIISICRSYLLHKELGPDGEKVCMTGVMKSSDVRWVQS